MKPFKLKVDTKPEVRSFLIPPELNKEIYGEDTFLKLEAIHYSCQTPGSQITLFDKDGDQICFPIPGQLKGNNLVILDSPITVQLPMEYEDDSTNTVTIHGTLHKIKE